MSKYTRPVVYGPAGLTEDEVSTLFNLTYDDATNILTTNATFRAGLNSFLLGWMHSLHSGGENLFTQNLSSLINWYSVWCGYRPYNFDGGGPQWLQIAPSARIQATPVDSLDINGPIQATGGVTYADVITLQNNETVWGVEVVAGETYEGDITYTLNDNSDPEIIKFSRKMSINVVAGELIHIHFPHPSESHAGSIINVDIVKEGGAAFLVRPGTNGTSAWIRIHLCTFRDVDVALDHKEFVTSVSGSANWGSHYIVSLDNAGLDAFAAPVAVASHARQSFRVQDGNSGFSNNNGVVVTLVNLNATVVTATLNKRDDNCEFIFDGAVWRFINDRTGKAGIV